ncbi:MAG: histidine phosphatase family protein [Candidatus Levybacteria bacterium]|nr:histidine phosphatase family protein [Candidatus Levybacteria bacterium]
MITRIFFVRHGQVDNPDKVMYGRLPGFPLSQDGKAQIAKTAELLSKKNVSAIYASPLLRTKQSAKIIADILHLPINYSEDILEIKSSLQGQTFSYISAHFPKLNIYASAKNNFSDETIEDVAQRMQEFSDQIIKKYKGKNIAVIGHGDPIMIIKAQIRGLPLEINSIRPIKGYIQPGEIYAAEFNSL